jgi:hypothetical protein
MGMLLSCSLQIERAIKHWATLPVSASAANSIGGKPYNKLNRKVKKEPVDMEANLLAQGPSSNEPTHVTDPKFKIEEFSSDRWSDPTRMWAKGIRKHGLDSVALMQPLVDQALQFAADQSSASSVKQESAHKPAAAPVLDELDVFHLDLCGADGSDSDDDN